MTISAMLQLKKDSYLIISPEKLKIKRSKDRNNKQYYPKYQAKYDNVVFQYLWNYVV